jgi:hypothetical protein
LLALAYGPFVQNLVVIYVDFIEGPTDAQLAYATYYAPKDFDEVGPGGKELDMDNQLIYSIKTALQDKADQQWLAPPSICRTSNCYWPDHYTLATCSRCADISDKLKKDCSGKYCDATLPNGFHLRGENSELKTDAEIYMALNHTAKPLVFNNYTNAFITVQSISVFDHKQYPTFDGPLKRVETFHATAESIFTAQECVIVPCIQQHSFALGKESPEKGKQDDGSHPIVPFLSAIEVDTNSSYSMEGKTLQFPGFKHEGFYEYAFFELGNKTFESIKFYLSEIMQGYVTTITDSNWEGKQRWYGTRDGDSNPYTGDMSFALETIYNNSAKGEWFGAFCDWTTPTRGDAACGLNNIAVGLTNGLKTLSWQSIPDSVPPLQPAFVNGTTYVPAEFCQAQWQYVSAPVAVWALGLMLLVGTVWKTRRASLKTWRTSPLAMLLLSMDGAGIEHLQDWRNMGDNELKEMAAGLRLKLHITDDGAKFVKPRDVEEGAGQDTKKEA